MNEQKPYVSPETNEDVDTLEGSGCTFDYVIKALVDICRHTEEQAEQCAIIVHCHGKCAVKHGAYSDLLPMHSALLDKQLTTEIQE